MKARVWLSSIGLFAIVALLVPIGAAQEKALITAKAEWGMDHEMVLDETGRTDMDIIITVTGNDFICLQEYSFFVGVVISGAFAKWGGTSIVPNQVGPFVFTPGSPGTDPKPATGSPNNVAKLNVAWDVESAPKKGAMQEYSVIPQIKPATDKAGPCQPSFSNNEIKSGPMVVRLPDRTEQTTTGPEGCDVNPFQPMCQTETAAPAESPGFDVAILLLGVVGMAAVWRRKQ